MYDSFSRQNQGICILKNGKRDIIFIAVIVAAALLFALGVRMLRKTPEEETGVQAYVQVGGEEVLRVYLSKDGKYKITDGVAEEVTDNVTLETLGEDGKQSRHDVNFILVKDGSICCIESNCENQVCVHTPAITGDFYDTPIVCLPHGMFIYVVENAED